MRWGENVAIFHCIWILVQNILSSQETIAHKTFYFFCNQMGEPTQRCISCAPVQRLFDGLILWNIESCSSSA